MCDCIQIQTAKNVKNICDIYETEFWVLTKGPWWFQDIAVFLNMIMVL